MTAPLDLGAIEELEQLAAECRNLTFGEPMCTPMSRYRFALLSNGTQLLAAARELAELKSALDFLCREHDAVLSYVDKAGDHSMGCTEAASILDAAKHLGWTPGAK